MSKRRAQQFLITLTQGDQTQEIEILKLEETTYMRTGDTWMQSPGGAIDNIAELTLMTPQNVASVVGQMEVVGTESVNDVRRRTIAGSKEIIPVVGTEGDTLDVSRVESAQLDIWANETYNAIVRLSLEAHNSEPPMTATLTFDYTDLNSDITIDAPEPYLPATRRPPRATLCHATSWAHSWVSISCSLRVRRWKQSVRPISMWWLAPIHWTKLPT